MAHSLMTHPLSQSTGYDELDGLLPQGGWPLAGLTEVLAETDPIDALNLLAPMFKQAQAQGKSIVLLVPPSLSYMPMLVRHGLDLRTIKIVRENEPLAELDPLTGALRDGNLAALVCLVPASAAAVQRAQRQKLSRAAKLGQLSVFLIHSHGIGEAQDAALRLFVSKRANSLQVRRITSTAHEASTLALPLQAAPLRQPWPKAAAVAELRPAQAAALPLPTEPERLPRRGWPFRHKPKPQQACTGLFKGGWTRWAA